MRCLLILLSLLLAGGIAKADLPPSSRIAAVVNKSIISQADLINRLRLAAMSSGFEQTAENLEKIKPQMIRVMIDEKLQLAAGEKYDIKVTEEQVNEAITRLEENNGMPKGQILKLMKDNDIPIKTLEDQIKANLIWVELIREKYSATLQIPEWEIEKELKLHKEKDTKPQHHLAEIFLPFDGPEQEERAKNDLNRLLENLQQGAHFSALAQQFSQAPTAAQGGDMGWLTDDQLSADIKEVVSHMEPGQLSKPIRTSQGYVIIGYIEKKSSTTQGDTLLTMQQVMLPFPKEVTEEKARAIMGKAEQISKEAKSCADLDTIAKTKFPGATARISHNQSLSTFPEPLQKVILSLNLNQTSEPLLTEEGALLVMVCEKQSKNPKEVREDDVRRLIAERKLSLLARRELRDLKRQAFIEMRM